MRALLICLALAFSPSYGLSQDLSRGSVLFEQQCAVCHGEDARGNGTMADEFEIQPSDLTQIKNNARGTFPTSLVIAKIDGRVPLMAYGTPMPIFGPFFEGKGVTIRGEDGILIMTSQPVIDLVEFLKAIQVEPK